jgi:hypothetical protein
MFSAADLFEVLAALILFLITGIAQWIQQRNRKARGLAPEPGPPPFEDPYGRSAEDLSPPAPAARPPAAAGDWEVQLRRLLEGDPGPPPPLPPPLSSPVALPTSSAPPRIGQGEHDETAPSWEEVEEPYRPLVTLDRAEAAANRGERLEAETDARMRGAVQLSTATHAIDHAANLHDTVAARMRGALAHTSRPSSGRGSSSMPLRAAPAAAATLGLLRNTATVRQAFVASVVFQKPKALE